MLNGGRHQRIERKNTDRHQRLANAAVHAAAVEGAFARREHSIVIGGGSCIRSSFHRRMVQFGDTERRRESQLRPDRGTPEIDDRLIRALRIEME